MNANLPRILTALTVVAAFAITSVVVTYNRQQKRSVVSGYIESQPTQLAARIQGRVIRLLVQEGQTVAQSTPLVELDATPLVADADAKQALVEQAQQQQREAENGTRQEEIRRQQAVVAEAQANLTRLRNGARTQEVAQTRARFRQADAVYRKTLAGARPQEIAQARGAERAAYARLQQAQRGLTDEEKAQVRARLDAAAVQEKLAAQNARRYRQLFEQGAVSAQYRDQIEAERSTAEARHREQQEAYQRAEEGTRPEEQEAARQTWQQSKAALELLLNGTRREDKEAALAERTQARQALELLQAGSRPEDIQAAEARLEQARAALSLLQAGTRREQIAQVRAAVKAAQANARSVEANLAERIIRAPSNVVIERVLVASGDLVAASTPLLRVTDPSDLWIRVYVPEARLANVTVGSQAQVRVDGIAEPLSARVDTVATQGEFTPGNLQTPEDRGKQVFSVRLRFPKPDPRLKPGMAVTITRIGDWMP